MDINIICVGKIKEKYLTMGVSEFLKRMKSFAKVNIIELKEFGNDGNRDISINKEANLILSQIDKIGGYTILLDIFGEMKNSEEMANFLEKLSLNTSTINFVIGGSYGVNDKIRQKSNLRLSFSKLTFPHQMMRFILMEQIYRWYSIINNGKYHK